MTNREEIEQQLTEWAANNARRDGLVRAALLAGVTPNRIHTLTGIARTTVYRIKESAMAVTYTAAIGTASDVVAGDFCDVMVAENDIVGYREDEDGNEIPEYEMGSNVVMPAQETTVRTDEADPWGRLEAEAVAILAANGWRVVGPWELGDNAAYATVELA